MKKNALLTFLFVSILSLSTFSQWEFQNPVHTNEEHNDIQFVDENHGWAVGEYGTILHSNDGGNSWIKQHSNSVTITGFHNYQGVYFTDIVNGWVAGWYITEDSLLNSCLMHTSDEGINWDQQYGNSSEEFLDVWFTDPLNGWLVGAVNETDGFIRHTYDGGLTWTQKYTLEGGYLRCLCFVDDNNGWAVGDKGNILYTSDGGENWVDQFSGIYTSFKSVCFTDLDNGWAFSVSSNGNRKIYHTLDGGTTWIEFITPNSNIGEMFFVDSNCGWYSIYSLGSYEVRYTTDGGTSWNSGYTGNRMNKPLKFFFIDSDNGWAIGENLILHSSDGGLNLESQNSASNAEFKSVFFTDPENGWALGQKDHPGTGSWSTDVIILHTNNGGNNWKIEDGGYFGWSEYPIFSLFFADQNTGWVTGGGLLKTIDGGMNWDYINDIDLRPIFFIDTLVGWGCGCSFSGGTNYCSIYRTTDGGNNWGPLLFAPPDSYLNSIVFLNLNEGWIVGGYFTNTSFILHTDNGGSNWEEQLYDLYEPLNSVTFIDSELGWAVGDSATILHTVDGGVNWVLQACPAKFSDFSLKSVSFANSQKGWIAGSLEESWGYSLSSLVLLTNDGGETWQEQFYRPYSGLTSIQFIDSENGWAVGDGGTIIHTNNGGITDIQNLQIPSSDVQLNIYPNPSKEDITIEFELPRKSIVEIAIYDLSGKICQNVTLEELTSGKHHFVWNTTEQKPGVYFCTLKTNEGIQTRKIIKL